MILVSKSYWGGAPFDFGRPPDGVSAEPVVLRAVDFRESRAIYWTPPGVPRPRVAVVCMHPRVDFTRHYTFPRLLEAGIGCLGANTRNPNDDTDTVHEAIALDLAACVQFLREQRGAERVILLGNSGGASLAALYQTQALLAPDARIARTPAGARTRLANATMSPADGMIYLAAHRGEGHVLAACIDPSVADERDPLATDPALDMYDPDNGFRPPPAWSEYDAAFIAGYRQAQLARVRRLDAIARAHIARGRRARAERKLPGFADRSYREQREVLRREHLEPIMVIYRTMANPNYVALHLDPSPREYGSLLSDRPDIMNVARLGFARTCTPRAWLSTWSAVSSNADLVANAARIPQPTLMITAGRDREIYPATDNAPIAAAVTAASSDAAVVSFADARHYFESIPGEPSSGDARDVREAMLVELVSWVRTRFA